MKGPAYWRKNLNNNSSSSINNNINNKGPQ